MHFLRSFLGGAKYVYEVGIIDFFNARHALGDEPAHAHSWKVEIKVRRPRYLGEQSLIGIEETRDIMRRLFARYEDRFLNDIPPFTFQEPTAENLAAYLFEQLDKEFRGTEAVLQSLTIWESPTNYVTFRRIQEL
ncbi:MAG: 6-carboxytetrahydropterin synthase [Anaerolineae bacterium]|nr:6-carboxytetrahydropterin synthase [Anaerolineae bacterium]